MPAPQRVFVIAKQRAYDEEKWKELLLAMAYYLHEQHTVQTSEHHTQKAPIQVGP